MFTTVPNSINQIIGANVNATTPITFNKMMEGGVDSDLMVAIGNAEGTRTLDGKTDSDWYGHDDPGNNKWNKGTCSWQVGGADSPEAADQLCIQRLSRMVPGLLAQIENPTPLVIAAIADSTVQSPRAAKDFPKRYRECLANGKTGFDAVLCARVESFRDPATGEFDAPGLTRNNGVEPDQRRRLEAIARVLEHRGINEAPQERPQAGAIQVTLETYEVTGDTPDEIRQSMSTLGPQDPHSGRRFDGFTRWNLDWNFDIAQAGGLCQVGQATVTASAILTMPKWVQSPNASAATVERWRQYEAALKFHEDGHVANGEGARAEISQLMSAIAPQSCDTLQNAVNAQASAIVQKFAQRDRDYDRETGHGATQGAVFP